MSLSTVYLTEEIVGGGVSLGDSPNEDELSWLRLFDLLYGDEVEELDNYQAYYEGDQAIVWSNTKFVEIFGPSFAQFRDNWCEVVVDAAAERLTVTGFRSAKLEEETGDPEESEYQEKESAAPGAALPAADRPPEPLVTPGAQKDPELDKLDKKMSAIWRRNRLDATQEILHTSALIKGKSYLLCWPDENGLANICFHDAALIRCWYDENDDLIAAAKQWQRADGTTRRNLYFKDRVEKWLLEQPFISGAVTSAAQAQKRNASAVATGAFPLEWIRFMDDGDEAWPIENPYDRVPVIPFLNKPHNSGQGTSEIKNVIPQQDAINKELADMMVASEYGAFRQKVIASKGRPKEGWKHGPNQLWSTTDTDAKWGDFEATPLENFIQAVEMWVQHVGATTRTPRHYFVLEGGPASGESLKTSEAGLVAKVRKKSTHFGNSWEDAMRLALEIELGADQLNAEIVIDTQWQTPETRVDKETWEVLRMKEGLGIPREVLWAEGGYSPEEIEDFQERVAQQETEDIGNALLRGFESGTGAGGEVPPSGQGRPPGRATGANGVRAGRTY